MGKPSGLRPVDLLEEAVVAAGRLRAALDDVAGGDGAGQPVPIVACPAEAPGRRAHDQRGVADPPGDDDVGAAAERLGDAPAAEVGVGRQRIAAGVEGERRAAVEVAEALAGAAQLAQVRHQIIPFDDGDTRLLAQLVRQRRQGVAEAARIEPAGVRHDLDVARQTLAQDLLQLRHEGADEAAAPALALLGEDGHGQLGQVVAGEHVDGPATHHLGGTGGPIAPEARAVGDTQRRRRHARQCTTRGMQYA